MKPTSKVKNKSYNCNINQVVDRILTIAEDLYSNSGIGVVKEVLMRRGGEKVVGGRTRTCA